MGEKGKSRKGKNKSEKAEKKLKILNEVIRKNRRKTIKLLSKSSSLDVSDYVFIDRDGNNVLLSQLFADKNELIVVHNMGKSCSYCTLWADGFNGVSYFIEKKAAFALVSPDPFDVQREFADSRGWKFRMYSGAATTFIKDMGFQDSEGRYMPGVSVFVKNSDGSMRRTIRDYFFPGDWYCSVWHLFDLLPSGKDKKE
jgi:predicted dithiol-disulfide oxidoreductase (DUF899 family)